MDMRRRRGHCLWDGVEMGTNYCPHVTLEQCHIELLLFCFNVPKCGEMKSYSDERLTLM